MADNELKDIRTVRREISKRCGHKLEYVLDYYEDVQKRIKATGRYEFVDEPLVPVEFRIEDHRDAS